MEIISSFKGKYHFLSNFWSGNPFNVNSVNGVIVYKTNEHFYQAHKTLYTKEFNFVLDASSPGEAKKRGRKVTVRKDWDEVKLKVMEEGLRKKFSCHYLITKLVCTYPLQLIEGNIWGDRFWGVCKGTGDNHLGKLLMKIRGEHIFKNRPEMFDWGFEIEIKSKDNENEGHDDK